MHTGTTLHLTELNWEEEVVMNDKLLHIVEFSSPWCIYSGTHSCDDMTEAWKELGKEYDGHPDILIGAVAVCNAISAEPRADEVLAWLTR